MAFNKKTWKDEVVQFPKRYNLIQVSGTTYDLNRITGTVTEQDPVNAEQLNRIEQGIADAHNEKADKNSPVFTGTPSAPTASPGTNTTQIATTAFVTNVANQKANLTGGNSFTGNQTIDGNRILTSSDQNELRTNDLRNANWTPQQWFDNGFGQSFSATMIFTSTLGIPGNDGSWAHMTAMAPWPDTSVGVSQIAHILGGTQNGQVWTRMSTSATTWGPWRRMAMDTGWKLGWLNVANWIYNPGQVDGCNYSYTIMDADIATGDVIDVEIGYYPYVADYNAAKAAGIDQYVRADNGFMVLWAATIPSKSLECKYRNNK